MKMFALLGLLAATVLAPLTVAAADGQKHPVFVLSPHKEKYSAWSLYVVADKADPSKAVGFGLEKLERVNSLDAGSYEAVVEAQKNPATPRENLGELSAAEFGQKKIEIVKNDALKVTVQPQQDGSLKLDLSMRITSDQRFNIGGKEDGKREVIFKYNAGKKAWEAVAGKMKNAEGDAVNPGEPISGVVFPVTGTGIYRIVGVTASGPVVLLDK